MTEGSSPLVVSSEVDDVKWTYSVEWKRTAAKWETRWDIFGTVGHYWTRGRVMLIVGAFLTSTVLCAVVSFLLAGGGQTKK